MCNDICLTFVKKNGLYYYCQGCGKYIWEKNLFREKNLGRKRCVCCKGLVRNKVRHVPANNPVSYMSPTVLSV